MWIILCEMIAKIIPDCNNPAREETKRISDERIKSVTH